MFMYRYFYIHVRISTNVYQYVYVFFFGYDHIINPLKRLNTSPKRWIFHDHPSPSRMGVDQFSLRSLAETASGDSNASDPWLW